MSDDSPERAAAVTMETFCLGWTILDRGGVWTLQMLKTYLKSTLLAWLIQAGLTHILPEVVKSKQLIKLS